ncbi:MAG: hypothetical protein EP329_17375 [Deltaproteobacteria bacterium]|nr:MAG: hypothetical protein EP329_17375 [Deltaproteobacteria bacterium]
MRKLFILALALAATSPALAAEDPPPGAVVGGGEDGLQVIVGPGGTSLEGLAVPDARCVDGAGADACKMVTSVLRRDMTLSFFFEVLPARAYLVEADSEPLDAPSFQDWTNIGAAYLIKAEVRGADPYDAEFRFYEVAGGRAVKVDEQSFKGLGKGQLRSATHRFCNGVMKARTGRAGVFDTRVAYAKKLGVGVKGIGIVDMDGYNRNVLISNGSINILPSWGFGGVLYTSFIDGHPELFFGKRKLSRDRGHYRRVSVSPDGARMIASISYGEQSDLYLLSKDGEVVKNLTNSGYDEVSPTFSPDGSKIAFVSNAAGSPQIYMMSVGGGEPTRLTFAGDYNYAPDWGSNGLIAFAAMEDGSSDIFTVTEGGQIARLTQNQGNNKDPSWSPDGRYVAFVSQRSEGTGIYVMSADGRYQTMIAPGGGVSNVAWEK